MRFSAYRCNLWSSQNRYTVTWSHSALLSQATTMRWAQRGDKLLSLTNFPHHALHTWSILPEGRPRPDLALALDSHHTLGYTPSLGPRHSAETSAQHASLTSNRHRASSQWDSVTSDASPPPSVSVTNRNVRAGDQPNHKLKLRLRQPEVFFLKVAVPTTSLWPQGSADFLVANRSLCPRSGQKSGVQEEF